MIRWLHDYFIPPGDGVVGGAIVSVLLIVVPAVYAWVKHLRPHMHRLRQIHDHLNPDHPFRLGGDDAVDAEG